jgi:hypothetical protein
MDRIFGSVAGGGTCRLYDCVAEWGRTNERIVARQKLCQLLHMPCMAVALPSISDEYVPCGLENVPVHSKYNWACKRLRGHHSY